MNAYRHCLRSALSATRGVSTREPLCEGSVFDLLLSHACESVFDLAAAASRENGEAVLGGWGVTGRVPWKAIVAVDA